MRTPRRAPGGLRGVHFVLAGGLLASLPSLAAADLVYLKNGRVLSVESWQLKGDVAVMVLWSGGQMEAPQSAIAQVLPDEYPRVEPEPPPVAHARPKSPMGSEAAGDIQVLVNDLATRYGVDAKLAQALVQVESNYQPGALSPKGAMGLMQLMPAVAAQYAVADPFDPAENLEAGLRHLRGLLDRFPNDVRMALAAYNAGLFAVTRYGGIPPYPETENYVRRIMSLVR